MRITTKYNKDDIVKIGKTLFAVRAINIRSAYGPSQTILVCYDLMTKEGYWLSKVPEKIIEGKGKRVGPLDWKS